MRIWGSLGIVSALLIGSQHALAQEVTVPGRVPALASSLVRNHYVQAYTIGEMTEARRLVAHGIEQHEMWWQFAKSPAWALFRADAEEMAMLRVHGFA